MKILVIGGTGLLGFEGAQELIRRGHCVLSISLRPMHSIFSNTPGMTFHYGNYLDMSDGDLRRFMDGCEGLVFAAGIDERVEGPAPIYNLYKKYNIDPLARLLPLARSCGIKHVVVCGSYFVHFDRKWPEQLLSQQHPYIRSRTVQEELALSFADDNFHVAVLEFPYIFGVQSGRQPVWMFLAKMIRRMKPATFYPSGGTTMITVKQAGQCIAGAVENNRGGQAYPVGYYYMNWNELLTIMHRADNTPRKPIFNIPKWVFRLYCKITLRKDKESVESGLNVSTFIDSMYAEMYIDKTTIVDAFGVEPDDIEGAIFASGKLCYDIINGSVSAVEPRPE